MKDAAASSIYGSRAPFGVVLVTTKSGSKGKAKVNYNNNFRWVTPIVVPEILDSYSFAAYYNEAALNNNGGARLMTYHATYLGFPEWYTERSCSG